MQFHNVKKMKKSKKMTKFISAVEARTHLGQVLDEAQKKEYYLIIKRKGKPLAAILSVEEFEDYLDILYDDPPAVKEALIESQKDYEMGRLGSLDDLYKSLKPLKDVFDT
jgi:prevent-host-death family protein